jgi:hypothetical protein
MWMVGEGLTLPAAETQPPPDQRLPPRETRTPLRRTTARTPELHRQTNAMEIERSGLGAKAVLPYLRFMVCCVRELSTSGLLNGQCERNPPSPG